MKKLLLLISIISLLPLTSQAAYSVGWNSPATSTGYIQPNPVNGVNQAVQATYFTATSTTATSSFAGNVSVGTPTTYTVGNVTGASMFQDESAGGSLTAFGYIWIFDIYAYKNVGGTKIYSATADNITMNDNGDGNPFQWNMSWPAVAGADGYKVIIVEDDYDGFYNYENDVGNVTNFLYNANVTGTSPVTTPSSPYLTYPSLFELLGSQDMKGNQTIMGNQTITGNQSITGNSIINNGTTQTTTLTLKGISSGGNTAYDPLVIYNANTGSKLAAIGDDSTGYNGTLYLLGNSSHTSQIGELDWVDQAIIGTDQRIITYQGYKDNATNNYYFGVSPLPAVGGFGATYNTFVVSGAQSGSAGVFGGNGKLPKSKFDVNGNVAIGSSYAGVTAAPTNGLIVQGNVGIGSTTPIDTLSIKGTTGTNPFVIASSSNSNLFEINQAGAALFANNAGTSGYVLQSQGSSAAPQWVATSSLGIVSGGTPGGASSTVQFNANGTFAGNNNFVFNGTNVGIGTSSPTNRLEVNGNTYVSGTTQLQGNVGIGQASSGYGLDINALNSAHFHYSGQGDLTITHSGLYSSIRAAGSIGLTLGANGGSQITIPPTGKVGIGSSTPSAQLSVQSGASTGDAFTVSTSSGNYIVGYDNSFHRFVDGPVPSVSSCGTGATVLGDDQLGVITTGSSASTCTLTFATQYNSPDSNMWCTTKDTDSNYRTFIQSLSSTTLVVGAAGTLNNQKIYYECAYIR